MRRMVSDGQCPVVKIHWQHMIRPYGPLAVPKTEAPSIASVAEKEGDGQIHSIWSTNMAGTAVNCWWSTKPHHYPNHDYILVRFFNTGSGQHKLPQSGIYTGILLTA